MTSPSPLVNAPPAAAAEEGGLNAFALERLADGVDLFVSCDANDEYLSAPRWIRVRLDQPFMQRLVRLRALCVDNELTLAETKGWPAACDDSGTSIKYWSLRGDRLDFWFFGQPKGDGSVQSKMIKLDTICEALSVEPAPHQTFGYNNCFWYGGAIVFQHSDDADGFLALLDERFPQLPAREREMEMTTVLAEHKGHDQQPAESTPTRRAVRV